MKDIKRIFKLISPRLTTPEVDLGGPPFWEKKLVAYIGNHWSVTGASLRSVSGPPLMKISGSATEYHGRNEIQQIDNQVKITVHKTQHWKIKTEQHEPPSLGWWSQYLRKGKQILLHMLHPSYCSFKFKPDTSAIHKKKRRQDCSYNNWNLLVVICETVNP